MVNAVKTRRLSDLYSRGTELVFEDDIEGGEPIAVWLQKLNPIENETAVRAANASRARIVMEKGDKDSEAYLSVLNEILEYTHEDLVDYLSTYDVASRADALEAEYAEEKEWTKEDYLQGLHDVWEDSLKAKLEEYPNDEEALKVQKELERYEEGVQKRLEQEREAQAKGFKNRPRAELEGLIIDQIYKLQADMQWMAEYHKQQLYLGVREPDNHKKRYFQNRVEVDELEVEVLSKLLDGFGELDVSVTQGKDSPEKPDSSSASKPQETEEEHSSGQKE